LGIATALLFTFPLIAYEGIHCAGSLVQAVLDAMASGEALPSGHNERMSEAVRNGVVHKYRWLLALIFTLLAGVPGAIGADTSAVIGFVGAFCGIPIMYIFPCLIFLKLSGKRPSDSCARMCARAAVVMGGVGFLVCSAVSALAF
jgi:hypothetical protein